MERQCGVEASAIGADTRGFEDVGLVEPGRGIQREFVGPQEVLPVAIVLCGMCQVDIRPDGNSLALWLGGAGDILLQLKTPDARRFDMGPERVEQVQVDGQDRRLPAAGR